MANTGGARETLRDLAADPRPARTFTRALVPSLTAGDNPRRPCSLVLSLVLRATLAVAVDPIAAATGLPSPVVAQLLGAVALDAVAALVSPRTSRNAPLQVPAPRRGRPRRRRRRVRGRRRGR